jgi:L-ornithine N5-oxygenase
VTARHHLLGVGFGPSHLSLAAVYDSIRAGAPPERIHFLEAAPAFSWHPGMLLDGGRMQVAFLKDLVSPTKPTSPYSFTNYLVTHGRLEQFLNLGTLHPSRHEFVDYFRWAADQLAGYVSYDHTVERIRPVSGPDGEVIRLEIDYGSRTGARDTVSTDHVSLAPGGRPVVPAGVDLMDGVVFHSSAFLTQIARFQGHDLPYRFLVVGAGQSAGEIFEHLAGAYPAAQITLAHRGFALKPADSSALANEIFNPESVDLFHGADPARRRHIIADLRSTNYAVVNDDDISTIARLLYDQRVRGGTRLELRRFTELAGCDADPVSASAVLRDLSTGETYTERFDAVVLATGYDFTDARGLLADLEPYLLRDSAGALLIGRDYAAKTTPECRPKVFLHGAAEHTHGLASTLLSVLAHRSADILDAAFSETLLTKGVHA